MKARVALVSLLVACVSFSHAQQLTQADIQAAFVDALKEYASYCTGQDYALATVPIGDPNSAYTAIVAEMLTLLGSGNPYDSFATRWDNIITQLFPLWLPRIAAGVTNRVEAVAILQAVRALGSVTNQLDVLDDIYSVLDRSTVPADVAILVKNQVSVDDLRELLSASSNQLDSVLGILRNEENPIEVDIRTGGVAFDILEQILHAIQDGSSSGAGFVDGVTNLANQGYNVPVDVKNFDAHGSSLDAVLSMFASDLSKSDWNTVVQNFDGEGSDWLTAFEGSVLMRSISNYASRVASSVSVTSSDERFASSVETNILDSVSTDEVAETNALAEAESSDDAMSRESYDDEPTLSNPWESGSAALGNFSQVGSSFFATPDPALSGNVILMGSNDPGNGLLPLPRIDFYIDDVLDKTPSWAVMRNVFYVLWLVLGYGFKLILLRDFVDWLAKRKKA